ncbi:MAG: RNA-binding S4 domain-containing protein, partial [Clostridia bacterium]|nr:RNA-binding S4 domain-containing protein [Clostridia bacterium]
VIKRRTVAADACSDGRVSINDKVSKPSANVKVGDIIKVAFGDNVFCFKVLKTEECTKKENANLMYEILGGKDES